MTRRLAPAVITALMISGLATAATATAAMAGTTGTTATTAAAGHRPGRPAIIHADPSAGHTKVSPSGTIRAVRRPTVNVRDVAAKLHLTIKRGAARPAAPRVTPHDAQVISPPTFTANYAGLHSTNPSAATNGTRTIETATGSITVFDSSGAQVCATIPQNRILTTPDGASDTLGTAQVQYDPANQRFIMLANANPFTDSDQFPVLYLAVSASNDPCGSWFPYRIVPSGDAVNNTILPSLGQDNGSVLVGLTENESDFSILHGGTNDPTAIAFGVPKALLYSGSALPSVPVFHLDGVVGLMASTNAGNPAVSSTAGYFIAANTNTASFPNTNAGYDLYAMAGSAPVTFTYQAHFGASFLPADDPDQPFTDAHLYINPPVLGPLPEADFQAPGVFDGSRVWFAHTIKIPDGPGTTVRYGFFDTTTNTLQFAQAGLSSASADFNASIGVAPAGAGVDTVWLSWATTSTADSLPLSPTVATMLWNGGALPAMPKNTTTVIGGTPTDDQSYSTLSSVAIDPTSSGLCAVIAHQYYNASDPTEISDQPESQVTRVCRDATIRVPNVTGESVSQAQAALHSGFLAGDNVTSTTVCATANNNQVVSTSPAASSFATVGSEVTITWCNLSTTVPRVIGFDEASAERAITGAGLVVGTVTQVSNCNVEKGDITGQVPGAGPGVIGTPVNLSEASGFQANGKKCVVVVS